MTWIQMKLMFDQLKNKTTTQKSEETAAIRSHGHFAYSTWDQALFSFRFENNIPAG